MKLFHLPIDPLAGPPRSGELSIYSPFMHPSILRPSTYPPSQTIQGKYGAFDLDLIPKLASHMGM